MNKIVYFNSCLLLVISFTAFTSCNTASEKQNTLDNNGSSVSQSAHQVADLEQERKLIVFFGNSLTAGYGLEEDESFPVRIQERIDSLDLPYQVVNAGLSGETTASGLNRLDWVLKNAPDVFVLELGGNDGLRGLDLQTTRDNLESMILKVREDFPEATIVLAGMQIPPNMGAKYAKDFQQIYPELAEEHDIILIPFLLEGVGGEPELNLPDGIHPTAEGQKIVAENVWQVLRPVLEN